MPHDEFARLADEAVGLIPKRFRDAMTNLAIVIEDEPPPDLLAEMAIEPPDTLYGLYSGTPITERRWDDGNRLPDRITLYRRPIEEDAEDEDDARVIIAETLLHEVGHYFGLSEDEIEEIEEHFWHSLERRDRRP
ncbi:MAG: metallopeptidase family protein [Vicinamibacterales bacterium]